jgi:hypothetical protein
MLEIATMNSCSGGFFWRVDFRGIFPPETEFMLKPTLESCCTPLAYRLRSPIPFLMLGVPMLCVLMLFGLNSRAATRTISGLADCGAGTLCDQVAAAAGDTIDFGIAGTIMLTNCPF